MGSMLVVTVTCPDRPGIVDDLSRVVLAHGASWQQSRMVRLGGVFAGLVQVDAPPERVEALGRDLRELERGGMSIAVRPAQPSAPAAAGPTLRLALSGADHEGIVRHVARLLASRGVNVEELETEVTPAPLSGVPLFSAHALLRCPADLDVEDLRARLAETAAEQAVDIGLDGVDG